MRIRWEKGIPGGGNYMSRGQVAGWSLCHSGPAWLDLVWFGDQGLEIPFWK